MTTCRVCFEVNLSNLIFVQLEPTEFIDSSSQNEGVLSYSEFPDWAKRLGDDESPIDVFPILASILQDIESYLPETCFPIIELASKETVAITVSEREENKIHLTIVDKSPSGQKLRHIQQWQNSLNLLAEVSSPSEGWFSEIKGKTPLTFEVAEMLTRQWIGAMASRKEATEADLESMKTARSESADVKILQNSESSGIEITQTAKWQPKLIGLGPDPLAESFLMLSADSIHFEYEYHYSAKSFFRALPSLNNCAIVLDIRYLYEEGGKNFFSRLEVYDRAFPQNTLPCFLLSLEKQGAALAKYPRVSWVLSYDDTSFIGKVMEMCRKRTQRPTTNPQKIGEKTPILQPS
jgi:hypothetical protein